LSSNGIHPLQFLSPALSNITAHEKSLRVFLEHGGVPTVIHALCLGLGLGTKSGRVAGEMSSAGSLALRTSLLCVLLNAVVVLASSNDARGLSLNGYRGPDETEGNIASPVSAWALLLVQLADADLGPLLASGQTMTQSEAIHAANACALGLLVIRGLQEDAHGLGEEGILDVQAVGVLYRFVLLFLGKARSLGVKSGWWDDIADLWFLSVNGQYRFCCI
jgi:hypothetical protein